MSLIVVDTGKEALLDFLTAVGGHGLSGALVDLYTNNQTPVHGSVIGDFTLAAWTGYAQGSLTGWNAASLDGSNRAKSTPNLVTFNNTSGSAKTAYGYVVRSSSGGVLIFAELFTGGSITINNGTSLELSVPFTQQSEF